MKINSPYKASRILTASVLALTALVTCLALVSCRNEPAEEMSPTELPTPQPTSDASPAPYHKPITPDEIATAEKAYEEDVERRGGRIPAIGPETAGATIELNDLTLTLPDDAYIELYTTNIVCIQGQNCPRTPLHLIARGESRIEIDFDGNVIYEEIEPGEENIFAPLIEALERKDEV